MSTLPSGQISSPSQTGSPSQSSSAPGSPPWSIATKSIVAVTTLVTIIVVVWRFQNLLTPLVLAGILAYLLNPPIKWIQNRFNISRAAALTIVYVLLVVIFSGSSAALGLAAISQLSSLLASLPTLFTEAVNTVQDRIDQLASTKITLIAGLPQLDLSSLSTLINLRSLAQQAVSWIQPVASTSGSFVAQLATTTISTVSNLFLMFVVSIYLVKDSRAIGNRLVELAGHAGYAADAERLIRDFIRIWNSYLRGQVILALVIGVVVGVSLRILGVTNSLGLGVLAGFMEFLPIVGPLVSGVAAVLVAFFQEANWLGIDSSLSYALLVGAVMIIIQQLENNILVPRIVGDALDLHPLLVMISVLMGASLAGILGAVLAAPVVASIKLIGGYGWRKLFDLPPFPNPEPEEPEPHERTRNLTALWHRTRRRLAQEVRRLTGSVDPTNVADRSGRDGSTRRGKKG